jgi:hypothetical protein
MDLINVFCLDGNEYLLFISLSNGIVVALLINDDEVVCRDMSGGSISRLFGDPIVFDSKSSLFDIMKSSTARCFAEG